MNPIWRVAHEMSKSRSETQRKNQKRREAARQLRKTEKEKSRMEAIERDRKRYLIGQEKELTPGPNILNTNQESTEEETAEEKFQRELDWCKEQLELGLISQKPSSDIRKVREAEKALKILKSSKAPMVKKRQVMRTTFGDYRKKMKEEEKRSQSAMSKSKMITASSHQQKFSSTYYKKSAKNQTQESTTDQSILNNSIAEDSNKVSFVNNASELATTTGTNKDGHLTFSVTDNTPFKFNFEVSEELQDSDSSNSQLDLACNATQNLNIGDGNEQFTFNFNLETKST